MTEPPRPGDGPPGSTPDPTAPPPPSSYSVPGEAPSPGSAPPPSYETPSYQPPSYETPSYDAPPPPGGGYGPPTSGGGYAPPPTAPGGYPPPGGAYGQPGGYPAPGTYPTGHGGYGPPGGYANNEDKTWALVAHFGGALGAFIGGGAGGWIAPLVALLARGGQSPTVRAHAVAALNFQLLWSIIAVVGYVLMCILIGFVIVPIAWLVATIIGAIAGFKANEGQLYRYPMSISMIN